MRLNKPAFTFIELLIAVAILAAPAWARITHVNSDMPTVAAAQTQ